VIVTNEVSVTPGIKVATALIGAHLPELTIKLSALRGVESFGMFCSAKTLGLTDDDKGLLQFDAAAPVGISVREYLHLDDTMIDVALTPNRGDCLSIVGIAREIGVANQLKTEVLKIEAIEPSVSDQIHIEIKAPEACPRYVSRVIRKINPNATTPLWMQEKLRRGGLRSIHPVVDVTNYVMLELGQPMHAFDLNSLGNRIVIDYPGAAGKETTKDVPLLNGEKRDLKTDTLTIQDGNGQIVALAGLMGAIRSSIVSTTTDIVLESAFFAPDKIMGKARQYGLHTDSSHRFERGVDPQLQLLATHRATALLLEIVGGQPGPCVEKIFPEHMPKKPAIFLREARIKKVLGIDIAPERVTAILEGLGIKVQKISDGWNVEAPSFRFDLNLEVDCIEELGRIYGYNKIPATLPQLSARLLEHFTQKIPLANIRAILKNRAYHEVIGYSFVEPKLQNLLDQKNVPLPLSNPISPELSVMRTTLWASLLPILLHNQKRQQTRIRIFETGLRFVEQQGSLQQIPTIAGLVWGAALPEQWGAAAKPVDFYDIKNDVEALLAGRVLTFADIERDGKLHPGRGAQVMIGDKAMGYVGALHPEIEQKLGLNNIYGFELDLTPVQEMRLPVAQTVSKYPAIRRDLAIVVSKEIKADTISSEILKIAGNLLNNLIIFDVYQGQGIAPNQMSIAFGLVLQAADRTLVDEEVNQLMANIINGLQHRFAAVLRE
jgi:phenylalanyl-tRNA synthetase beta chain